MKKIISNPQSNCYIISLLIAAFISVVLITYGWVITPGMSVLSVVAAYGIVLIYAAFIIFFLPKIDKLSIKILKSSYYTGLFVGLIFTGEIILEYIIIPDNNSVMGLFEYGSVFLIFFISSVVFTYRNNNFKHTLLAALISGIIGSLIWIIVILFVFYLFHGTDRQELVFLAEGNYQDFARSGMGDFNTFIMEDFYGAALFHSLLLPLISAILAAFGGGIVKLLKLFTTRAHKQ